MTKDTLLVDTQVILQELHNRGLNPANLDSGNAIPNIKITTKDIQEYGSVEAATKAIIAKADTPPKTD